jgi:hypothetical protein
LRDIFAERDAERGGLRIAYFLIASLIYFLEVVIGVMVHGRHVAFLS